MLNAWLKITMCRRSRDQGLPIGLKDQLEDLKHVGNMTFWKTYKEQERTQLEKRSTELRQLEESG